MNETVSGGTRPRTLAEKVWDDHVVVEGEGEGGSRGPDLLFIDLHLVHEVTSPQAFDGLRLAGRRLRRPDLTLATEDHNVPTDSVGGAVNLIADQTSRIQIETLRSNFYLQLRRAESIPLGQPVLRRNTQRIDRIDAARLEAKCRYAPCSRRLKQIETAAYRGKRDEVRFIAAGRRPRGELAGG